MHVIIRLLNANLSYHELIIKAFISCVIFFPSVQQSSYYGLAGMLPGRNTQAIMVGESVAGLAVSVNRVVTKAATNSLRVGAIAFFVISLLYILFCVLCQLFLRASPFVRYHVSQCKHDNRQTAASDQEVGGQDSLVFLGQHQTHIYVSCAQTENMLSLHAVIMHTLHGLC